MSVNNHIPVLKDEVIKNLNLKENGFYVDCTFGSGGHSKEIISKLSNKGRLVSFDCDQDSFNRCPKEILEMKNFSFVNENFSDLTFYLEKLGISSVDGFVFDLGLSSEQIFSDRGFSYKNDDDFLDMRMNKSKNLTAYEILNSFDEKEISDIIFLYGEERFSRRIARSICNFRKKEKIVSVGQLIKIVIPSLKLRKKTLKHPAKKVFQALRIAVNNELDNLSKSIFEASSFLSENSSLIVISYHSLEDRIVKRAFKTISEKPNFTCLKKPIVPTEKEIEFNNKSRSAKMRILWRKIQD